MPRFRKLSVAQPLIIEFREWSRIDEELKVERIRLTNRLRDQLWRYYPQMLKLGDLVEDRMLDLWEAAPTPEKAAHASKAAIARVLKKHRKRRCDTTQVLSELRKPALFVGWCRTSFAREWQRSGRIVAGGSTTVQQSNRSSSRNTRSCLESR
jgi:hypothetical protein